MRKKGFWGIGLTAILLGSGLAIASVLIFFAIFKVHVDLQMREEYVWNKVQEVPLALFSMSLDNELFVSKVNKVYYLGSDEEKEELKEELDDIISSQLFLGTTRRPYTFLIMVSDISLNKEIAEAGDCECQPYAAPGGPFYKCSSDCGPNEGKDCCITNIWGDCTGGDVTLCFSTKKAYSAGYPFPLTFNGTTEFIDSISYEVVQFEY